MRSWTIDYNELYVRGHVPTGSRVPHPYGGSRVPSRVGIRRMRHNLGKGTRIHDPIPRGLQQLRPIPNSRVPLAAGKGNGLLAYIHNHATSTPHQRQLDPLKRSLAPLRPSSACSHCSSFSACRRPPPDDADTPGPPILRGQCRPLESTVAGYPGAVISRGGLLALGCGRWHGAYMPGSSRKARKPWAS